MVYATQQNEKKSSRLNPMSKGGEGYSINVLIPINEDKTQKCTCATDAPHIEGGACSKRGKDTAGLLISLCREISKTNTLYPWSCGEKS